MESTGVYWIPLVQILEVRGFEVCLVNVRVMCRTYPAAERMGLLPASFRPSQDLCALRSLLRHRDNLEIHTTLMTFDSRIDVKRHPLPPERTGKRKPRRNEPRFNLRQHLYRSFGVDLTQIPDYKPPPRTSCWRKSGRTYPNFAGPRRWLRGWVCVCTTISAEERFCRHGIR
jgi:hypothetical protein